MKYIAAIGVLAFVAGSFASSSPSLPRSGASYAQPGTTATVRLALNPASDVLFNRHGPSLVRVSSPLGKALEMKLPKGTPYPPDAENYDQRIPALAFKIPIPKNAKPGAYPVRIETELYLCDAVQHICYRSTPKLETVINVGQTGRNADAVLELTRPTKPGV